MSRRTSESAQCHNCGRRWPRDPVLEVACPVCGAAIGHPCRVARPSAHVHSAAFAGLPPWGHDARELLAAVENKYGCDCGISLAEARRRLACVLRGEPWDVVRDVDLPLFAGACV